MNIKNILVTGASGKVGRNAIPELIKAGYKIRALRFDDPVEETRGVEIIDGDLRDPALAKRALADMDAVIHLANVKENRELFLDSNIKGTFHLLDESRNCGHIQQFIQAGSDARVGIYYYPHPFPIEETAPHQAYPGYYAFSKVLEETMCEQMHIQYDFPVTVLRFSWVFDQDDILAHVTLREPNFGVPVWKDLARTPQQKAFFEKHLDGVARLLHPDGKPGIRHIVGIKDVVQAIVLSVGNQAALGEAFTVAGPAPFSYEVLAKYVSEKLSLPVVDFTESGFHDFRHSIAKGRNILGYDPQYDIMKIVDDAIAFRKSGGRRRETKYPG